MSLVLFCVFVELPQWLQQDGAKLFFFACAVIALFALTKWASRMSESSYSASPPEQTQDHPIENVEPQSCLSEENEQDEDSIPPARRVEFTLRWMRFKSFDLSEGPADPDNFCDELDVELNYANGLLPWNCIVATPMGLAATLGQDCWNFIYAEKILIVSRYDVREIQTTVLRVIRLELESVPEEVAEDEMADTQGSKLIQ